MSALISGQTKSRSDKSKKKHRPPIRLSRSSSARSVLKASEAHELDEAVETLEEAASGLPNQHALHLMRRLYKAVDKPFRPVGLSFYDKVQSLQITTASDLLKEMTWKDFFGAKGTNGNPSGTSKIKRKDGYKNGRSTSPYCATDRQLMHKHARRYHDYTQHRHQRVYPRAPSPDPTEQMGKLFSDMVDRVQLLWRELKVSGTECEFYSQSLCKRPVESFDQCKALAHYICALQEYRKATIVCMKAIDEREAALSKTLDTLAIIFCLPSMNNIASSAGHLSEIRQLQTKIFRPTSPDRKERRTVLMKEDLVIVLKALQMTTMQVVRAVQRWRSHLWRPLPFYWQGRDYLTKLREDLEFLEGDSFVIDLINSVPLAREDMPCLLFDPAPDSVGPDEPQYDDRKSTKDISYSNTVHFQEAPPAAKKISNSDNELASSRIKRVNELAPDALEDPLRQWFIDEMDQNDLLLHLQQASYVVADQEALLEALTKEALQLAQQDVFIPSIKVTFAGVDLDTTKAHYHSTKPTQAQMQAELPANNNHRPTSNSQKNSPKSSMKRNEHRNNSCSSSPIPDISTVSVGSEVNASMNGVVVSAPALEPAVPALRASLEVTVEPAKSVSEKTEVSGKKHPTYADKIKEEIQAVVSAQDDVTPRTESEAAGVEVEEDKSEGVYQSNKKVPPTVIPVEAEDEKEVGVCMSNKPADESRPAKDTAAPVVEGKQARVKTQTERKSQQATMVKPTMGATVSEAHHNNTKIMYDLQDRQALEIQTKLHWKKKQVILDKENVPAEVHKEEKERQAKVTAALAMIDAYEDDFEPTESAKTSFKKRPDNEKYEDDFE